MEHPNSSMVPNGPIGGTTSSWAVSVSPLRVSGAVVQEAEVDMITSGPLPGTVSGQGVIWSENYGDYPDAFIDLGTPPPGPAPVGRDILRRKKTKSLTAAAHGPEGPVMPVIALRPTLSLPPPPVAQDASHEFVYGHDSATRSSAFPESCGKRYLTDISLLSNAPFQLENLRIVVCGLAHYESRALAVEQLSTISWRVPRQAKLLLPENPSARLVMLLQMDENVDVGYAILRRDDIDEFSQSVELNIIHPLLAWVYPHPGLQQQVQMHLSFIVSMNPHQDEIEHNAYYTYRADPFGLLIEEIYSSSSTRQNFLSIPPDMAAMDDNVLRLKKSGDSFLNRFRHTKREDHIDVSVAAHEAALSRMLGVDTPGYRTILCLAASALVERYNLKQRLPDISQAISDFTTAVNGTLNDHPDKPRLLDYLAIAFLTRFSHTRDVSDMSSAITYEQMAVEHTPDEDDKKAQRLSTLGIAFLHRSNQTRDSEDITKAISSLEQAIQRTPESHINLPLWVNDLGNAFQSQFSQTQQLVDISAAIIQHQRAIQLTPADSPQMASRLNTLANAFLRRFERIGDQADITNAISYHTAVFQCATADSAERPRWLSNLGTSYLRRFRTSKNPTDASLATQIFSQAVGLTPDGHASLPRWLNDLGMAREAEFSADRRFDNISSAIADYQRAVEKTPESDIEMPSRLANLGRSYSEIFEITRDETHISTAISYQNKGIQLTPISHVDMSPRLQELGDSYTRLFQKKANPKDLDTAISNFRLAASQISGHPSVRLSSALKWAQNCEKVDPHQSLEAFGVALDLLTLVAGIDQTVQQRHSNLTDVSALTTQAAGVAFSLGEIHRALEWLEQGRCIVWNQLNQLQTPLEDLRIRSPTLADRFSEVSQAIQSSGSGSKLSRTLDDGLPSWTQQVELQDEAAKHVALAKDWEELLGSIRNIPSFHNFLRPRKYEELLQHLPHGGTVVIINVYHGRCDALALRVVNEREPPKQWHTHLHKFNQSQAESLRDSLNAYLRNHGVRRREMEPDRGVRLVKPKGTHNATIVDVLEQLWTCVVNPILEQLEISYYERKRIWWCATGPLAFLPIHAAGLYGKDKPPRSSLSDYAISSYTPTVSLLPKTKMGADIRSKTQARRKVLLISQPNTPGLQSIPNAKNETDEILVRLTSHDVEVLSLEGRVAVISRVQQEIMSYNWIHLACHAIQDTQHPLKSGFHLHDGRMELNQIITLRIPSADFAFLSACQTSAGDEKLSEEAVHLAGGMLAAGYRGVVGTMWSIVDKYGPEVSKEFYVHLLRKEVGQQDGDGLDSADAAYALDHATRLLRDKLGYSEEALLTWVPYVHFGL